jgi:hypothetical protein
LEDGEEADIPRARMLMEEAQRIIAQIVRNSRGVCGLLNAGWAFCSVKAVMLM